MRKNFDQELNKLNKELIKMGHLVESAIDNMIEALKTQDIRLAEEIIENDRIINDTQRNIEALSFSLMLRQQPIASDLRNVTSAIKVVTDLERIGDHCADIAEMLMGMKGEHLYLAVEHIPIMAKKTKFMVKEAIESFIQKNLKQASSVKTMDDDIDQYFDKVKQEVIQIISEKSEKTDDCLDFLMIGKYLERMGDHAVNICEWLE